MILHLHGTVHGNRIELDRDPGLPPGAGVSVQIEPIPDSVDDKKRRLLALAGIWKDDPSIADVFAEIQRERRARGYRDVNFDDPPR